MGNAEYMGLTFNNGHSVVILCYRYYPYLPLLYRFINRSFRLIPLKKIRKNNLLDCKKIEEKG